MKVQSSLNPSEKISTLGKLRQGQMAVTLETRGNVVVGQIVLGIYGTDGKPKQVVFREGTPFAVGYEEPCSSHGEASVKVRILDEGESITLSAVAHSLNGNR